MKNTNRLQYSEKTKYGIKEMKKGSFVESDSYVIPNCEPKYKGIVCYKDSESDIKFDIDIMQYNK